MKGADVMQSTGEEMNTRVRRRENIQNMNKGMCMSYIKKKHTDTIQLAHINVFFMSTTDMDVMREWDVWVNQEFLAGEGIPSLSVELSVIHDVSSFPQRFSLSTSLPFLVCVLSLILQLPLDRWFPSDEERTPVNASLPLVSMLDLYCLSIHVVLLPHVS